MFYCFDYFDNEYVLGFKSELGITFISCEKINSYCNMYNIDLNVILKSSNVETLNGWYMMYMFNNKDILIELVNKLNSYILYNKMKEDVL